MPECLPDRMPEDLPDRITDRMPEDMPEDMPDRMPDGMPEDIPEHMPEDTPDRMPEGMPDRMPDRMPEDMSDRMPEDLPVTKCINVMVGITRSKVICVPDILKLCCPNSLATCWLERLTKQQAQQSPHMFTLAYMTSAFQAHMYVKE